MKTFNEFWELLSPKAEYANRRRACFELWNTLPKNRQDAIYEAISDKLSKGKFVDYNPLFALKNNNTEPRPQMLSYDEYYKRYGTTLEQDGWTRVYDAKMQRTTYVKHDHHGTII